MSTPFLGEIVMFGGNFAPVGWAFCNGQLLDIAQNSALFSLLGTIYGGDGRTNFALPDLRGRAPIHFGNGAGLPVYNQGQKGGVENVILTTNQIPSHNHNVQIDVNTGVGDENNPNGQYLSSIAGAYSEESAIGASLGGVTANNVGSNQSHINMQPYLAVNFIIATVGIFPS